MNKIILFIIALIFVSGCSYVRTPDIFRDESPPDKTPEDKTSEIKGNVINAGIEDSLRALVKAVRWAKWDIAFIEEDNSAIILKEAYVYRKDGKLLRVYHWPEGQYIASSDISDYINKIATSGNSFFGDPVSFTQESMRITLTGISSEKTEVDFEYVIRPFKLSESIKSKLNSSGYIENLILEKASKLL